MPTSVTSNVRQRGAMLIEAMIGILIFSMGILALVGMQALAIKQVADAKYRADASFLANRIIGEMWVNRTDVGPPHLGDTHLANTYAYAGDGSPPAALTNWVTSIRNGLPGITATVNQPTVTVAYTTTVVSATLTVVSAIVTVTLFWQPPGGATTVHNYVVIAYMNIWDINA